VSTEQLPTASFQKKTIPVKFQTPSKQKFRWTNSAVSFVPTHVCRGGQPRDQQRKMTLSVSVSCRLHLQPGRRRTHAAELQLQLCQRNLSMGWRTLGTGCVRWWVEAL